jgi:hypothetical protein
MWPPLDAAPWELLYAGLITAVASLIQGAVGFGFAVISVPLLALVNERFAPVPQLLLTLPLAVSMVLRERESLDLRGAGWVLVGRIPGALLGLLLLRAVSGAHLELLLGALVLLGVGLSASGWRIRRHPGTELGAGAVSGVMSLVASIGGPPLALLYRDASGPQLRATLAAIFSVGLFITLSTRILGGAIAPRDLQVAVLLLPGLLLGLWASRYVRGRIEGPKLRVAVLSLASAAAVGVVLKGLAAL